MLNDGAPVKVGDTGLTVSGSTHSILIAERLVFKLHAKDEWHCNQNKSYCGALKDTKTKILDTRKTTPGLRYLEKWAVKIGGGVNHRMVYTT